MYDEGTEYEAHLPQQTLEFKLRRICLDADTASVFRND